MSLLDIQQDFCLFDCRTRHPHYDSNWHINGSRIFEYSVCNKSTHIDIPDNVSLESPIKRYLNFLVKYE